MSDVPIFLKIDEYNILKKNIETIREKIEETLKIIKDINEKTEDEIRFVEEVNSRLNDLNDAVKDIYNEISTPREE